MFANQYLKDDEGYKEFLIILEQTGLTNLAVIITRMCQLYLGLDPAIEWCCDADEDLCAKLMDYVIDQGNFGNKKSNEKVTNVLTRYSSITALVNKLQKTGLKTRPAFRQNRLIRPFAWIFAGLSSLSTYLASSDKKVYLIVSRKVVSIGNSSI